MTRNQGKGKCTAAIENDNINLVVIKFTIIANAYCFYVLYKAYTMEPKHFNRFFGITNFLKDSEVQENIMHLRQKLGIREIDT